MPNKIKKEEAKKLGNTKNTLLNIDSIHYVFLAVFILIVLICVGVGVYKYSIDKYHAHASVAIKEFIYTERVDDGYNILSVEFMEDNIVYVTYGTPQGDNLSKWSINKYLNFNEELYLSGIFDNESQIKVEGADTTWSIEVELITGDKLYYSSDTTNSIDKAQFSQVIYKYFSYELLY